MDLGCLRGTQEVLSHRRWDLSIPELRDSGEWRWVCECGDGSGLRFECLGMKIERPGETVREEEERKVFSEEDMVNFRCLREIPCSEA